jgi:DNA end-binding protein Ku
MKSQKGDYVIASDEELAAIDIESTHAIDTEKFVARSQVDPVYLDKHYFIAPATRLARRLSRLFAKPCGSAASPGMARVALHGRERLILLEAKGIMGTTLHHNASQL